MMMVHFSMSSPLICQCHLYTALQISFGKILIPICTWISEVGYSPQCTSKIFWVHISPGSWFRQRISFSTNHYFTAEDFLDRLQVLKSLANINDESGKDNKTNCNTSSKQTELSHQQELIMTSQVKRFCIDSTLNMDTINGQGNTMKQTETPSGSIHCYLFSFLICNG